MVETLRPIFQLSLAEVEFRAPETPHYLELALQLLEARLKELQATEPRPQPESIPESSPTVTTNSLEEGREIDLGGSQKKHPSSPLPIQRQAPGRRTRWFQIQLPQINLPDNSQTTPRSLEELKELLRAHGLSPHPRGDASMLLWQVRNRLGGIVEAVPI